MRALKNWPSRILRSVICASKQKLWFRPLASVVNAAPLPAAREETIRLRQYQEECIESVLSYLKDGHKRLGISLATGSGKTVIFTQLIGRLHALNNHATQTLILAHRSELVQQAARHCMKAYPDKRVEIEMGSSRASGLADITVASVMSMVSNDRLDKYDPTRFKLVLVDEAHHIVSPSYMRILEYFGLELPRSSGPALVGVSATFSRLDGLSLGTAIDHIVYHKDYIDMIGDKWLADVIFTTVKSNANLSKVYCRTDGDFDIGPLARAVNTKEVNEITVKSWMAEASDRKSTLVFCVNIAHLDDLTQTFRQYGIDARSVTGQTPKFTRQERLTAFKNGEFPVLLNCGVFTEGTDIPNIDCVLLARPTNSRNLLVQMIGRGMRLYPGKKDCHVIDMVASLATGIVTTPTLFGLDPAEVVKSASAKDLQDMKERAAIEEDSRIDTSGSIPSTDLSDADVTFTHYDSVYDLIEDTSGERHVRSISQNAWVQVDSHKYILAARGGVLTLERRSPTAAEIEAHEKKQQQQQKSDSDVSYTAPLPTYHVIWKHSLPPSDRSKSPWSAPRTIATATTLTSGLNAADTFASVKFERLFIATSSSWRKSPASEGQLNFLNKLRVASDEEMLTAEDVTKGMAGDMITKVKFGARGRFDRLMVSKTRTAKLAEKARERRSREKVRVGPLDA